MSLSLLRTRTPDRPMAFTFGEFLRGMWSAWGLFLAILLGFVLLVPLLSGLGAGTIVVVGYGMVFGGGISLAAMAVFSPVAWLIGWCLRRVRTRGVHLAVFAVFGAVIGLIVSGILAGDSGPGADGFSLTFVVASAMSVALGWRHASKCALDGDDCVCEVAAREPRVHEARA